MDGSRAADQGAAMAAGGRRWVWIVRLAAIAAFLSLFQIPVPILGARASFGVAPIMVFIYPGFLLGLLRRKWQKTALAFAIGSSLLIFVVVIFFCSFSSLYTYMSSGAVASIAEIAIAQILLLASSIKAYYTLGREPRDRRKLAAGILIPPMIFWGFASGPTLSELPPPLLIAQHEAEAVHTLQELNSAATQFSTIYNSGFPEGLNQLGPPASGPANSHAANLLNAETAGRAKDGTNESFTNGSYRFFYMPQRNAAREPIRHYTITTSPLRYGLATSGRRSFLTNESKVIRATPKDRPATAQDPPI